MNTIQNEINSADTIPTTLSHEDKLDRPMPDWTPATKKAQAIALCGYTIFHWKLGRSVAALSLAGVIWSPTDSSGEGLYEHVTSVMATCICVLLAETPNCRLDMTDDEVWDNIGASTGYDDYIVDLIREMVGFAEGEAYFEAQNAVFIGLWGATISCIRESQHAIHALAQTLYITRKTFTGSQGEKVLHALSMAQTKDVRKLRLICEQEASK